MLISVTVVEPLAAQITAGVQTMEGKGCLHKSERRNKGFMGMQTSSGMNTDKIYRKSSTLSNWRLVYKVPVNERL